MDTETASRHVLNEDIATDRAWRGYTYLDAGALFGPTMVILTVGRWIVPVGYMWAVYTLGIGLLCGWGCIIYVLPDWISPAEFLTYSYDYIMTPNEYDHIEHNFDSARDHTHESPARFWHTDTRAQDIHRVDQFPHEADVVERRDGAFVGAIEVTSSNMSLAGNEKWAANVDAFEDFLEHSLDFDFTIYAPTRRFQKAAYVNRQRDRLQDPDVRENPVLEAMCADYADWLDVKLGGSSTATRQSYILVPVKPREVRYLEDEETVQQNLAELPFVGRVVRRVLGDDSPDESVIRERQIEAVADRLDRFRKQCINDLDGCTAQRITGGDLAELIYSHWDGEEFAGDMDELLRRYPIITADEPTETPTQEVSS